MAHKRLLYYSATCIISSIVLLSCHHSYLSNENGKGNHGFHSVYDDKTMKVGQEGPIMMPYNRFIDPLGTVVRFGNPELENHALDCVLLPDGKTLAVEDRYGATFIDVATQKVVDQIEFGKSKRNKGFMSVFSGIKTAEIDGKVHVYWTAADGGSAKSVVIDAVWDGKKGEIVNTIDFAAVPPAPLALANEVMVSKEDGEYYLYIVLNGNSQLTKMRLKDYTNVWTVPTGMAPYGIAIANGKAYVTNWAGSVPTDKTKETAGVPYAEVYTDPRTGGTLNGTVSVIDLKDGKTLHEVPVALHPNAILADTKRNVVYVANGNSDNVYVISTQTDKVVDSISVRLNAGANPFIGDSPNGLVMNADGSRLYVANGMDNALAVIDLNATADKRLLGFIPTEAYPAGMAMDQKNLYVCNLEGEGSMVEKDNSYNAHKELATVSIFPIPTDADLPALTTKVEKSCLQFRTVLSQQAPRPNIAPVPVPERIGEPSLIKHVVYIIKENRTYDQVLGDMKEGDGRASLCVFGDSVTPNQHELSRKFVLLDNYYASGKCSAEGHQWTDAAMTSDYVEKDVRAWFRSYPHVQNDALVYNKEGFIWNNALDHGKTVRIYGEACVPKFDENLKWKDIYAKYKNGEKVDFTNYTTISRVRPILSDNCPCADTHQFSDEMRADAFAKELKGYEQMDGDQWPNLMVVSLSSDHTVGTRPNFPTPRAMVADNDMAVGKIIEAISHSRFWANTAIFITEDDSQNGWDHVSAYRTTGYVISPYSAQQKAIHTNYNQTCMVRTIEQILGIPPMNTIDATALPMFDCFTKKPNLAPYQVLPNLVPVDELNTGTAQLSGKALYYAQQSMTPQFDKLDGGDEDLLNHILWFAAKGNQPYPKANTLPKKQRKDDDD